MFELICLGGVGAWTLITVIDLHAEYVHTLAMSVARADESRVD